MKLERELMRGAGPTAVLQLLSTQSMYGYQLVETLAKQSDGVLAMGQSTLYPMLYNLEAKGLIEADWQEAPNGRKRKYYNLTGKGKKKLRADLDAWKKLTGAMANLGILPGNPDGNPAGGSIGVSA
ncbi:MAG: helix-turn-helix transcriptional regulator [Phycisphaerales bacterium]|nr:helix-turn-helix transcriptional regulator [Phycisphaerales bacterium]